MSGRYYQPPLAAPPCAGHPIDCQCRDCDEKESKALKESEAAKKEAMKRVEKNAETDFVDKALSIIEMISHGKEFTTDYLWECLKLNILPSLPHEPRAMGAVMHKAAEQGLIELTGSFEKSLRPKCHRRPLAVWRRR